MHFSWRADIAFGGERMKESKQSILGSLTVFFITAAVFVPVLWGEFLNWDDNVLFLENPFFRGFSADSWCWMCSTFFYGHWQPVSWVSYAGDYVLWDMNPHGWHVANWLLHAINGALVFLLCLQFLRKPLERSSFVAAGLAALFYAVHPLRVEPAAWLATRGYLLGGAFCLLTMLFYLRDVRRDRYPLAALFFFTLAALTKGICMMLPPILLLLDWFPLGRVRSLRDAFLCGVQKIPFFLLSLLTGGMAFLAKQNAGGMAGVSHYGLDDRLVQSVFGVWFYVFKSISPQQLSPLYFKSPALFGMVVSFVLTGLVGVLLFVCRRRVKPVLVSVGASLLLIFPMIGITQSGSQLFADRFTYLAAIPFSVLMAVLLAQRFRFRRLVLLSVAAVVFFFGIQSVVWCQTWQSSLTLWECALAVDSSNPQAYNSAGLALKQKGQYQRALTYFAKAILLNPGYVEAWHNRSLVLAITGETDAALAGWERVLSFRNCRGKSGCACCGCAVGYWNKTEMLMLRWRTMTL